MYSILIVEDEPLVQIGIKSMLKSLENKFEVIDTATNGKIAMEIINDKSPDIVITDIKMPIMDGLTLIKNCNDMYKIPPVFIILTSYEEFNLAKRAIKYKVLDYLIKLELTTKLLEESLNNAIVKVDKNNERKKERNMEDKGILINFQEKFFVKLLYNLFDDQETLYKQAEILNLNIENKKFITCFCQIKSNKKGNIIDEEATNRFICTLNMVKEIINKYIDCFTVSLDITHFALVCYFEENNNESIKNSISIAINKVSLMIEKYFNMKIKAAVGDIYSELELICNSFQEAKESFNLSDDNIIFYSRAIIKSNNIEDLSIFIFKEDLRKAIEEYNTEELYNTLSNIVNYLKEYNGNYIYALDCACSLLYLFLNLLPDGEKCMSDMFSNEVDGYKSIYVKKNINEIIKWVCLLRDNICNYIDVKKKSYKHHIVNHVKKYINNNLEEKLYLNEVAELHNISPSYLSSIFKKECNMGFSEYISNMKINKAKELLINDNFKVYEVSDILGFESAFYFSKVFKKITGYSPKEYVQRNV